MTEDKVIPISKIEIDLEHPSLTTESSVERHIECVEAIAASLAQLERIVYPIVVCEDGDGHYQLIDGWGRVTVASDHLKQKDIWALVFPPLTLTERLELRLRLNPSDK